ncbi:hypothetical protein BaRGS_00016467 [Batillaria attramentaria]|uniref:Golgi resident protein GCP60 n=1 Tax=Batillaria attramentaria TaxID=370345 RepID=A0ABD0KZT4_9CAEN
MAAADSLANGVENLQLNNAQSNEQSSDEQADSFVKQWGFPLDELYRIALRFFKEKEGKALQLTYKDKVHLVALTKQVAHGKFHTDAMPEVGFLDVVGNDRRQAWQSLGDMSKETAMTEFIQQLETKSPLFRPYVEAQKAEQEEKLRKEKEDEEEAEKQRQQEQEMQIRAALNQQTAQQFRQYVQQQYPYNPQLATPLPPMPKLVPASLWTRKDIKEFKNGLRKCKENVISISSLATATVSGLYDLPPIAAASMWTRKDFKEFKDSLRKDKDSVIKIGSGETVTVRVPTHEDGTCLFWEFATDHYDLGFGVYFEWTIAPSNTVSVHVSESSDEEDAEEEETPAGEPKGDIEKGSKNQADKPPTDEIIPVYRRDCHEEVYCGSHVYPGRGVYLLKFDNSYSLWRSKTLYYRVYYSR